MTSNAENMCHYQNAVTSYEMALRFGKVDFEEAASYRKMARWFIRHYINQCNFLTQDDYLDVYSNVINDAKDHLNKPTA